MSVARPDNKTANPKAAPQEGRGPTFIVRVHHPAPEAAKVALRRLGRRLAGGER